MKKFFLAISIWVLLCMSCVAFAQENTGSDFFTNPFYRGDLSIETAKDDYAAGETLDYTITYSNKETFPLTDMYLTVEIVTGGEEHMYPSQTSDADNIVYEQTVSGLSIKPLSSDTITLTYTIPGDAKNGTYRIEAYLVTKKGPVVGIPSIFLAPGIKVFTVSGTGYYGEVRISRTQTFFNGETSSESLQETTITTTTVPGERPFITLPETSSGLFGPIGVGVNSEKEVTGVVYLTNSGKSEAESLVLLISVCAWDDTTCTQGEVLASKKYDIESLQAGETKQVGVSFASPANPDAYAIRLEVRDANNRTLSLYRSRIVVKGAGAKIRKLAVDKTELRKGEPASVLLLASASPDYITNPPVENVLASIAVKNGEETIYSGSKTLPTMTPDADFTKEVFEFTPPMDAGAFEVCGTLTSSSGEKYDEYCFDIDFTESIKTEKTFSAGGSYDEESGELTINACSENKAGEPVTSIVSAFLMDSSGKIISSGDSINLKGCSDIITEEAGAGKYSLIINDLVSGEQTTLGIDTEQSKTTTTSTTPLTTSTTNTCTDTTQQETTPLCGDARCGAGENAVNCCVDCGCTEGSSCVDDACMPDETNQSEDTTDMTQTMIGLGAILLIILGLYFYTRKGREAK